MVYWLHANTGQQVDGTGLVYLRARYYSGAFGRFLSRDVWEGNPNQPMTFNAWLYGSANPVANIDPSGRVTWGLRGTTNWAHELIEASYERQYGSYQTHLEFGSHLVGRSPVGAIDLIYFPYYILQVGGTGFEFGWMTTGEVYEIEPITHAFSPGEGVDQAERYIRLLRANASDLSGTVVDLGGTWNGQPFDWQYVQWDLGTAIGSEVRSIPLRGDRSILYWRQTPGVIVYVDTAHEDQVEEAMTAQMYARVREEFIIQAPAWVEREYRPSCFEVALDFIGDLVDRWAQYRAWAFLKCHEATGQCESLPILP